jgi:carbohydrate kinase (thermoresistant glucokinase family)
MSMAPSPRPSEAARIIVVMGVSSSGKSTIGSRLAAVLDAPFLDGDGYHPPANVEKMRAGTPLTDIDRWPWLKRLAEALREAAERDGTAIGACSALRRTYRDYLTKVAGEPILFIYLKGDKETIARRIAKRVHEYMPASLLDSQFATLEEPQPDENFIATPVDEPIETMVARLVAAIRPGA